MKVRLLLVFCAALSGWAQNVPVQEHTLPNGLKLLMVPRKGAPKIAAGWLAKVGSVNERPGITGISHLFEHMMFKGTHAIGTKDIEQDLKLNLEMDRVKAEIRKEEQELERRHSHAEPVRRGLSQDARQVARTVEADDGLHVGRRRSIAADFAFERTMTVARADQRREVPACRRTRHDERRRGMAVSGRVRAQVADGRLDVMDLGGKLGHRREPVVDARDRPAPLRHAEQIHLSARARPPSAAVHPHDQTHWLGLLRQEQIERERALGDRGEPHVAHGSWRGRAAVRRGAEGRRGREHQTQRKSSAVASFGRGVHANRR